MNTDKILTLARKHVAANPANEVTARVYLGNAVIMHDAGYLDRAKKEALKSLVYSVGPSHRDTQAVAAYINRSTVQ